MNLEIRLKSKKGEKEVAGKGMGYTVEQLQEDRKHKIAEQVLELQSQF